MKLFDNNFMVDICYEGKNPYVKKAIDNLILDFERVNKNKLKPKFLECFVNGNILIHTEDENKKIGMGEGFSIKTENDNVIIRGAGYLGTIYGIYTFSEKVLGISPCYIFDDKEIKEMESLEIDQLNIFDYPKTFKFRGMFINDEDLLTEWKLSGKKRHIDYPFYGTVTDISVIDKIAETAMRLKMNLIIPASFVDIDNPHEKEIIDCVTSHGIFVSQHHIEPCGVSYFGFDNYSKKVGLEGEASYFSNKENMTKVWKDYIEKWAKYDNVVWQIGHRGKADVPIWDTDKSISDDVKERGRIISEVYSLQKDMIMYATGGKAEYFTSTLWMEGAELFRQGVLKFPQDTIIVLSDIGSNQMFGNDYNEMERTDDTKRGIYYHSQYWGAGPHLIPGVGIDKMHYNLNKAVSNNDTDYIILNSSNVREFTYEIKAYSQMVWDFGGFSKEKYMSDYTEYIGADGEMVRSLIKEYYDSFAVLDNSYLHLRTPEKFDYNYDENPEGIKNFQLNDGTVWYASMVIMDRFIKGDYKRYSEMADGIYNSLIENGAKGFLNITNRARDVLRCCDDDLRRHIMVKWINPACIMQALYKSYISIYQAQKFALEGEKYNAVAKADEALAWIYDVIEYRKCAEYGEFENWYRGDKKLNVLRLKETIIRYRDYIKENFGEE
ncbi:MAG: hypothetical protein E7396_09520 [Ruminococcaceae bacterium]|nr:hypothetical protein [Oscillospiraceae bacterium]